MFVEEACDRMRGWRLFCQLHEPSGKVGVADLEALSTL